MSPSSSIFVIIKIDFVLLLLICGGVVAINFCVLFFLEKGHGKQTGRATPSKYISMK
jgi:hypothetical protein